MPHRVLASALPAAIPGIGQAFVAAPAAARPQPGLPPYPRPSSAGAQPASHEPGTDASGKSAAGAEKRKQQQTAVGAQMDVKRAR